MPRAALRIEQGPPESGAERGNRHQRSDEAQQGLRPAQRRTAGIDHAQFPCAHADGLAAARPRDDEVRRAECERESLHDEFSGERVRVERAAGDGQRQHGGDEPQSDQWQQVVGSGGEAQAKPRW